MPKYNYNARAMSFDDQGLKVNSMTCEGSVDAPSKEAARDCVSKGIFKDLGMYVVSISLREIPHS